MEQQDFASEDEARAYLTSFMGRPLGEVIVELSQGEESERDQALAILRGISPNASETILRKAAKDALAVCPDCFEAWQLLA